MKLFSSSDKNNKSLHNTLHIVKGLGHTPMTDWVAILLIGICALVGIMIFTTVHYMSTSGFIENLPAQQSNTEAAQIKTKEEKLRDVIELYTKRQQVHKGLLGNSQSIVVKDVKVENATSTVTATSTKDQVNASRTNTTPVATSTPSASN